MRAHGRDPAVLEEGHAVREGDRGGAVRDDECGRVGENLAQSFGHALFRFRIERGERIIEQEHRGLRRDRAGEGEALALAARKAHALLADVGVDALG